ncbi:hypothetical protein [Clostridium sp. D53t1_180928_C8]|uniref:hypothetical protein n=1 Tax=Clostridium sp. D53t1_180928_C8 TaxID=2787101 RepID=UPI0018AA75D9|nr:hypothetical protein [Clostridium sp. D53t1_180928_C8]
MKLKYIVLTILMIILIAPNDTMRSTLPISKMSTQGIYNFEESGVFNANVKLIKGDKITFFVMEPNQNIVLYIKLILNEEVRLKDLDKNYTICIIGDGEVAITYDKTK